MIKMVHGSGMKLDSLALRLSPLREAMRMLLIEDDAMSRELWTMLLESEGYTVTAAESGEQAVQLLQTARQGQMEAPDVVLADLQMPGLAGAALAAALRGVCRQRTDGQERPAPDRSERI
jgi:CheY-like chemotaxis protein